MDYFELLEYYENNRLKINTQNNADGPTKEDILKFLVDLNIRYQNLKEAYEPLAYMVSDWLGDELDMSDVFFHLDRIIDVHNIDFVNDTVSMMLGKIMYMLREPDYDSQFHLSDIVDFDFCSYWMQDWFDVSDLQRCYNENPDDFAVNLYDYFDDSDKVIQKPVQAEIFMDSAA